MSDKQTPATIYGPNLTLTRDEQALLRTALTSNSPRISTTTSFGQRPRSVSPDTNMANGGMEQAARDMNENNSYPYTSPDQDDPTSALDADTSPLGDFDLEDGTFEWDNNGEMFGGLPDLPNGENAEQHEKRKKSADEDDDEDDAGGKRRESDDRTSKKPGRKPLTGEPTTKRKAQNRAAQRAFRERKERHLKDLETKVDELEKASESTNHENGRLRVTVERLNTEVKEYRKRLSLTTTSLGRSPPAANPMPYNNYNNNNPSNDFNFAFPKFGDLPGSYFMSNGSLAKTNAPSASNSSSARSASSSTPKLARASSSAGSPVTKSPTSHNGVSGMPSSSQPLYQSPSSSFSGNNLQDLNGLFSPSILESVRRSSSVDYMFPQNSASTNSAPKKSSSTDSYHALANTPAFTRGASNGSTSSPSASSMSHGGLDSSCGTTPEPCLDSPDHRKTSETALNTISEEGTQAYSLPQVSSTMTKSPVNDVNGIDWLAQQNGGQFDPVLFNDYRDSQENIMNTNLGDFFNDAFLTQDFSTPFNTGEVATPSQLIPRQPTPTKSNPIKQCEAAQHANDDPKEVGADSKPKQFLSCDKLWDRLQNSEKVTSGEIDMDDLCSQLKSKAKCSGKGAVIDQADVDRIIGPPSTGDQKDFFSMFA